MAFINEEQKAAMSETDKKTVIEKEMAALVSARGFPGDGVYKFDPNPNVKRRDGSIVSGTVKGHFSIDNVSETMRSFERKDFSEKAWRKICTIMGYKYHVHTDIDSFTILPAAVEVSISVQTPQDEVL